MAKDNDLMWIETTATQLQQAKDRLSKQVDVYVANKDNSLEDRWNVWSKYGIKKHETYIQHFPEFPKFEEYIHDGETIYKYQTVDYQYIIDILDDYLTEEEELEEEEVISEVNRMKELLMKDNLGSYRFDW